jgi:tetratricopeptide (TPR) repeat protein
MRFFMRAIEMYEAGLQRYPSSFDLAYNKARVQYEISQHPKLVKQLSAPIVDVLKVALESHREALKLQQENEDVLFNTAQVLTSLAEAITDGRHTNDDQALKLLQEALELFQRCLVLQEFRYTESQEQMRLAASGEAVDEEMDETPATPGSSSETEQWASIIEPVTKDTLVDTAVAQLQTLTTLCGLLTADPGTGIAWVEEYWASVLQQKIDVYLEGSTDRQLEVDLARANFIVAHADISFRTGRIDVNTYRNEVKNAYEDSPQLSTSQDAVLAYADAKISIYSAISETLIPQNEDALSRANVVRWEILSSALETLRVAVSLGQPVDDHLETNAKINLLRGDAEMFRFRLGQQPWNYGHAQKSINVLLKNAETYYRGGAELAGRADMTEESLKGKFKESVTVALSGRDPGSWMIEADKEQLVKDAEEMVEDGLVDQGDMQRLLSTM